MNSPPNPDALTAWETVSVGGLTLSVSRGGVWFPEEEEVSFSQESLVSATVASESFAIDEVS